MPDYRIGADLQRLSGLTHNVGYGLVQNSYCMLWKKKNWGFSCVTIERDWLLHLG